MLENFLFPQLEENDFTDTTVFQQNDVQPHFPRHVMEILSETFRGRWIGRNDSVLWSPGNRDLTRLDVFIWVYVNNYVHMNNILYPNHLKARLREAAGLVRRDALQRERQDVWDMQGHKRYIYAT
jgi:hypothetical protein